MGHTPIPTTRRLGMRIGCALPWATQITPVTCKLFVERKKRDMPPSYSAFHSISRQARSVARTHSITTHI